MKLRNFQSKIHAIDPDAEFKEVDACAVRCSSCTRWVQMRALYDVRSFTVHRQSGRCQSSQRTNLVSNTTGIYLFDVSKMSLLT